jgi:DNA-binding MarR family transcriptional regulator
MTKKKSKAGSKPLSQDMDMSALDMVVGFHMRKAILKAQSTFSKIAGRQLMTGQWAVMVIIHDNPGRTQTAIAEAAGLDRSSLVPILNKLEKNGIIVREAVAGDKRAYAIQLTEKGESELDALNVDEKQIENAVIEGLGVEDHAKLIDLLKRFYKVF